MGAGTVRRWEKTRRRRSRRRKQRETGGEEDNRSTDAKDKEIEWTELDVRAGEKAHIYDSGYFVTRTPWNIEYIWVDIPEGVIEEIVMTEMWRRFWDKGHNREVLQEWDQSGHVIMGKACALACNTGRLELWDGEEYEDCVNGRYEMRERLCHTHKGYRHAGDGNHTYWDAHWIDWTKQDLEKEGVWRPHDRDGALKAWLARDNNKMRELQGKIDKHYEHMIMVVSDTEVEDNKKKQKAFPAFGRRRKATKNTETTIRKENRMGYTRPPRMPTLTTEELEEQNREQRMQRLGKTGTARTEGRSITTDIDGWEVEDNNKQSREGQCPYMCIEEEHRKEEE